MKAAMIPCVTLLFDIFISWLIGFLVLSIIDLRKYSKGKMIRLLIDYAMGSGILTLLMFISGITAGNFDGLIIFILGIAIVYLIRRKTDPKPGKPAKSITGYIYIIPVFVLIIVMLIISYKVMPLGWDPRFIYLFKAKMFFLENRVSPISLTVPQYLFSHPDYPLHISLQIAYLYKLLGHVDPDTAKIVLLMYPLFICIFMYSFLKSIMPEYAAVLSALAVFTLRRLLGLTYAGVDVPLALYLLIGTSFYYLFIKKGDVHYLILAGLSIGIGAWIKYEGIAYLASMAICIFVVTKYYLRQTVFTSLKRTIYFLVPGMVFILPWRVFIHIYHFPADWIRYGFNNNLTFNFFRLYKITESFGKEMILNEPFLIIVIISLIYTIYRKQIGLILSVYTVFFLQFAAYIIALYLQPNPLSSELGFTVQRLMIQITPSMLLVSLALLFDKGIMDER